MWNYMEQHLKQQNCLNIGIMSLIISLHGQTENELAASFGPGEALSQIATSMNTNPILKHSRDTWIKAHGLLQISQQKQGYFLIWNNINLNRQNLSCENCSWIRIVVQSVISKRQIFYEPSKSLKMILATDKRDFWRYLPITLGVIVIQFQKRGRYFSALNVPLFLCCIMFVIYWKT